MCIPMRQFCAQVFGRGGSPAASGMHGARRGRRQPRFPAARLAPEQCA